MSIYDYIHEKTGLPYGAVRDHLAHFLDELEAYEAGESDYNSPEEIAEDYYIPRDYLHNVLNNIERTVFTITLPAPSTKAEYARLLRRVKSYSTVVKCPNEAPCSRCINKYICDFFQRLAIEVETKSPKPKK